MLKNKFTGESKDRDKLEVICKASDKARILTQQLLGFSRKQMLELKVIDVNDVVASIFSILRSTIRESIDIKLELSKDINGIRADKNQIEQILMNLVINAQDAIKDNGTIIIATDVYHAIDEQVMQGNKIEKGSYFIISVSDSGTGIEQDQIELIFEPFFTTKKIGEGTGLGLATVYGLVKQHNGFITVDSKLGNGTKFNLYFPIVSEQPVHPQYIETVAIEADWSNLTILLAEDNAIVREMLEQLLQVYGCNVIVAKDPGQALLLSENQMIDLLISDVVMPIMNGPELHQQLLKTHNGLKVLYMSGHPNDILGQHGVLEEGINFIQKPFSVQAFAKKMDAIFK